jgi:hypothetical protein
VQLLLKGVEQLRAAVHPPPVTETVMKLSTSGPSAGARAAHSSQPPVAPPPHDRFAGDWVNPFAGGGSGVGAGSEVLHAITQEPTSLLDGDYDEAAERQAFQDAVLAWRNAGKAPEAHAGAEVGTSTAGTSTAGTQRGGGGRGAGVGAGSGSGSGSGATPRPTAAAAVSSGDGGGALLVGDVDEEAEHRAFRAAVESWRTGAKGPRSEDKASCFTCYMLFFRVRPSPPRPPSMPRPSLHDDSPHPVGFPPLSPFPPPHTTRTTPTPFGLCEVAHTLGVAPHCVPLVCVCPCFPLRTKVVWSTVARYSARPPV